MRDFTCKDKEHLNFSSNASFVEGEPCYEDPAYTVCLTDKTVDGAVMYHDMASIIQDVENFAERVGPSVVQDLMYQLQPQPLQPMDKMSDQQKFDCVVSRYCQTISERSQLIDYLSQNHSDLMSQLQMEEVSSVPVNAVAAEPSANG